MKKAFLILISLLLATWLSLPAFASDTVSTQAPVGVTVCDLAGLLSDAEENNLHTPKKDTHGIGFYLITMQTAFADDYLSDHEVYTTLSLPDRFLHETHAVVLVIRVVGAKFYYDMYTYGDADEIFSDGDVDRVLDADAVYGNLKSGNIGEGSEAFFALCADEIDGHYESLAAKERRKPFMVILFAVISGLLAAGGSVLGVVLFYRKKQHGVSYPLDRYAKLNLTHREDRFIGSHVTRVRVQSSNGGSRGGSRSGGRRGGR